MSGILKSEWLKLKGSLSWQLAYIGWLGQVLIISLYFLFFSHRYDLQVVFDLFSLFYPLVVTLVALTSYEQEESANHFQEMRSSNRLTRIWLGKLCCVSLLGLLPTSLVWLPFSWLDEKVLLYSLSSWCLLLYLLAEHFLLTLLFNRSLHFVWAFVQVILCVFISNHALDSLAAYFPLSLPFLSSRGEVKWFWLFLTSLFVLCMLNALLIRYRKKTEK